MITAKTLIRLGVCVGVFAGFKCQTVGFPTMQLKYRKIPKNSDARKLCHNSPKIQTNRQNLKVFCQKHANGIANSEDPDQTAPLGAV